MTADRDDKGKSHVSQYRVGVSLSVTSVQQQGQLKVGTHESAECSGVGAEEPKLTSHTQGLGGKGRHQA